jgi:chromosome segregation ATPase
MLRMKNDLNEKDLQLLEMKTKGLKDISELRCALKRKEVMIKARDDEIARLSSRLSDLNTTKGGGGNGKEAHNGYLDHTYYSSSEGGREEREEVRKLEKRVQGLMTELAVLQESDKSNKENERVYKKQAAAVQEEKRALQEEVAELQGKVASTKGQVETLKGSLKEAQDKLLAATFTSQVEASHAAQDLNELHSLQLSVIELKAQCKQLEQENTALRNRDSMTTIELRQKTSEASQSKQLAEQTSRQISQWQSLARAAEEESATLRRKVEESSRLLSQYQDRAAHGAKSSSLYESEINNLNEVIVGYKRDIEVEVNNSTELRKTVDYLKSELRNKQEVLDRTQSELLSAQSSLTAERYDSTSAAQFQSEALQRQLLQRNAYIKELESRLEEMVTEVDVLRKRKPAAAEEKKPSPEREKSAEHEALVENSEVLVQTVMMLIELCNAKLEDRTPSMAILLDSPLSAKKHRSHRGGLGGGGGGSEATPRGVSLVSRLKDANIRCRNLRGRIAERYAEALGDECTMQ